MVASGHGIQALKAAGIKNPGLVLNLTTIIAEDEDVSEQAQLIDGLQNRIFLDLLAGRGLPEDVVERTSSITDWSFVNDAGLAVARASERKKKKTEKKRATTTTVCCCYNCIYQQR